jgi:hypothetical protein
VVGHRARATIRLSGTLGGDQVARPRRPEPAEVLTADPHVAPGLRLSVRLGAGELGVLAEEFVARVAGGALAAVPVMRWSGLHHSKDDLRTRCRSPSASARPTRSPAVRARPSG